MLDILDFGKIVVLQTGADTWSMVASIAGCVGAMAAAASVAGLVWQTRQNRSAASAVEAREIRNRRADYYRIIVLEPVREGIRITLDMTISLLEATLQDSRKLKQNQARISELETLTQKANDEFETIYYRFRETVNDSFASPEEDACKALLEILDAFQLEVSSYLVDLSRAGDNTRSAREFVGPTGTKLLRCLESHDPVFVQ